MLKIMLVDDESLIREGLADLIDWKQAGFEIAAKAENGLQALEIMKNTPVDVIFSDIRMPFLDGLEFARVVTQEYPETYIIFISGYDEFEYAQEAIRLGAFDYILKPVQESIIEQVLEKIGNDYRRKNANRNLISDLNKKIQQDELLREQDFIRRLLQGKISHPALEDEIREQGFDFSAAAGGVLIVQIDDYYHVIAQRGPNEIVRLQTEFETTVKSCVNRGIVLYDRENECVICMFDPVAQIKGEIDETGRKLAKMFDAYSVTVASGSIFAGMDQASKSYDDARTALACKFLGGGRRFISYEEIDKERHIRQTSWENIPVDYDLIAKCIGDGNKGEIKKHLTDLRDKLEKCEAASPLFMNMIISNLFMYAIGIAERNIGSVEKVFSDPMTLFQKVIKRDTVAGMMDDVCQILFCLIDYLNAIREGSIAALAYKAKQYVERNYFRADLSLAEVAAVANMSANYFSMIFRQITGITFSNHLMKLRLQRAKELLENTDKKIYEIAEYIGYDTTTYFSTIFKRKYGISPVDYRRKLHGEHGDGD